MLDKTQTSLRQSLEFQTRMTGGWLGCRGRWCQKRQTDQGGKDMTTSVIRSQTFFLQIIAKFYNWTLRDLLQIYTTPWVIKLHLVIGTIT